MLFLQKISMAEAFNIADTQNGIQEVQSQMMRSQEKTQSEVSRLGTILTDMLKKLNSLERQSGNLELKSQNLTREEMDEQELGEIGEIVQETSAGARNIRSYYDAALAFQRAMQERLQNPPDDSESGSFSTQMNKWVNGVPTEGANTEDDEGIDVRSPEPSKHSSEPVSSEPCLEIDDDEFDENAEHQDPNILIHEIDFFQKAVDRAVGVKAWTEAKKSQRHSIILSEKLENLHSHPFNQRVDWMIRLAHITMDEGKPKSFEEARGVLNTVKRHVNGESIATISELDHFRALTYLQESRSSCPDNVRPLPDQNAALLLKAEGCAIKALQGRKKLAGPPRELIRDSVKFLMDLYDRLDRPAKRYAYGKEYSAFLEANETPPDFQQQAKEKDLVRRPLSMSSKRSFTDEERWLLQRKFELGPIDFINAPQKDTKITPLITAICENNPDADQMAERFIKNLHADVNRVDSIEESGISPLMWATKLKNHPAMQMLINARADLSFRDRRGRTLMHVAAEADSTRILQELFNHKRDLIESKDNAEQSPLHKAVGIGSFKGARYLLNRSADVNAQDKDGNTALHVAVLISSEEIVKQLLLYKPDLWLKNKDGRTVLEESQKVNGWNSKIYFLLKENDPKKTPSPTRTRTASSSTASRDMSRVLSHVSAMGEPNSSTPTSENKGFKFSKFLK